MNNFKVSHVMPLLAALVANGIGHAYFMITLPAVSRMLNMADLNVGLLLSSSSVLLIITGPIWGWLCDKYGRRNVLIIGLSGSAITTVAIGILFGFGNSIALAVFSSFLFVIRTLQAALSAGLKPATQSIAADLSGSTRRVSAMSILGATFGIGTVLGGVIAMLSGNTYLVAGYIFIGALMLLSTLWVAIKLPETKVVSEQTQQTLTPKHYVFYWLTTLIGLTIYSALQPITNWRLQDAFDMSTDQAIRFTGAIMMSSMLAMIMAQLALVKWHNNPQRIRTLGFICTGLALVACVFAAQSISLLLAMVLLGIGFGLFLPANLALMTMAAQPDQQGKLAGVNGMCQGIGLSLGPILGTLIYQSQQNLPYLLGAGLVLLLLLSTRTGNKLAH